MSDRLCRAKERILDAGDRFCDFFRSKRRHHQQQIIQGNQPNQQIPQNSNNSILSARNVLNAYADLQTDAASFALRLPRRP